MKKPEEDIIKAFEDAAELYGISPSHGRIYGSLYFSGEKMTLDELSEETGFAKSTVSNSMNDFENLNFVERKPSKDSTRKVYFEAREDFENVMEELVKEKFQEEIDIMLEAIEKSKQKMDPDSERYRRAEKLEKVYKRGQLFTTLLEKVGLSRLSALAEKVPGVSGKDS